MGVNTSKIPNEFTNRQVIGRVRPTETLPGHNCELHKRTPMC